VGEYVQVQVAIDDREKGLEITRSAVAARLAACAQVLGPMTSTYWWRGKQETAEEYLLLFKTAGSRYQALEDHIRAAHPYKVAEIIQVPVTGGLTAYLAWINEETQAPAGET
jgi:periplasmic divalent cation tolerance protein